MAISYREISAAHLGNAVHRHAVKRHALNLYIASCRIFKNTDIESTQTVNIRDPCQSAFV
jgi:hypothetical protein